MLSLKKWPIRWREVREIVELVCLGVLSPKKWLIRWREVHEIAVWMGFGALSPKNGAILRRRAYLEVLGVGTRWVSRWVLVAVG